MRPAIALKTDSASLSRFALLCLRAALGCPVSGLRFAIAVKFNFALDGVAGDLAAVLLGHLVPVELARNVKRDRVVLDFPILDFDCGGFGTLASRRGNRPGQLITIHFELEGADAGGAAVSACLARCPSAISVRFLVLSLGLNNGGEGQDRAGDDGQE